MHPKQVLFIEGFKFYDGETGNKLLVILHSNNEETLFIFCKTTTSNKYPQDPGCHPIQNVFCTEVLPFHRKTWIQFGRDALFCKSDQNFKRKIQDGKLRIIGEMEDYEFLNLLKCIILSEDIEEGYRIPLEEYLKNNSKI